MTTSAEFEIVRQIKEQCCYVAFNPQKEEEAKSVQTKQYQLPDGSMVDLGAEAFRAPEILFQPDLIGSESRGVLYKNTFLCSGLILMCCCYCRSA